MVKVHVERTIGAAPQRVFDWLADPGNLATAPLLLKVVWAKDSPPPGVGAVRVATGIGLWIREEITAFDPPLPVFDHEGGTLTLGEHVHPPCLLRRQGAGSTHIPPSAVELPRSARSLRA